VIHLRLAPATVIERTNTSICNRTIYHQSTNSTCCVLCSDYRGEGLARGWTDINCPVKAYLFTAHSVSFGVYVHHHGGWGYGFIMV
jgi:hypothetical protein